MNLGNKQEYLLLFCGTEIEELSLELEVGKERDQFGRNSWCLYQARPEDYVVTFAGFCWIVQPALVHPHRGATCGDTK